MTHHDDNCLFCKIIQGKIPSNKVIETEKSYAFFDIGPLSKGHTLVIPKYHGEKLHDIPDDYLTDTLIVAKKVVRALGADNYNILQNNGRIAHQFVDHVHFHIIPKPKESEGLVMDWETLSLSKEEMQAHCEEVKAKIAQA
ncbi:Adenosine 5'-monophosphoramidase [Actinomortierella ambigua]|nr:Adenosine 5'-monophosphoramidase [Actinomortierella ambigua]